MSGLLQVCVLWFWVCNCMLPVGHLAPNILMTVNYFWRQLAQSLGWAALAYHKKEGVSRHPGTCKFSLQHDGRPDWCLGERVGIWNVGTLNGEGGQVSEKEDN